VLRRKTATSFGQTRVVDSINDALTSQIVYNTVRLPKNNLELSLRSEPGRGTVVGVRGTAAGPSTWPELEPGIIAHTAASPMTKPVTVQASWFNLENRPLSSLHLPFKLFDIRRDVRYTFSMVALMKLLSNTPKRCNLKTKSPRHEAFDSIIVGTVAGKLTSISL